MSMMEPGLAVQPHDTSANAAEPGPPSFLAGRDFWPDDVRADGFLVNSVGTDSLGVDFRTYVSDIVVDQGEVWLLLGGKVMAPYDLETGSVRFDRSHVALRPGTTDEAGDSSGAFNAAMRHCSTEQASEVVLSWSETRGLWETPNLGLLPDTLTLSASGCEPELVDHHPGYRDSTGRSINDALSIEGCVEDLRATYEWTTCSWQGVESWHCPLVDDLDGDADTTEYGACQWWILFEGMQIQPEIEDSPDQQFERRLYVAYGAALDAPFVKLTADGSNEPRLSDARISSTHPNDSQGEGQSWASVPSLYWDPISRLWRAYFSTEVSSGSAQWYSESKDNGHTWGVDGSATPTVDCWDEEAGALSSHGCLAVEWADDAMPPDDPWTGGTPDVVDATVVPWPGDEPDSNRVLMIFAGANPTCASDPRWSSYGVGVHTDRGDMAGQEPWRHLGSTYFDPGHGVIVAPSRSDTTCLDTLHDFAMREVKPDRYLMFYSPDWHPDTPEMEFGTYSSASGFACSNGVDDDGDGYVDYGSDPDCLSPSDDREVSERP